MQLNIFVKCDLTVHGNLRISIFISLLGITLTTKVISLQGIIISTYYRIAINFYVELYVSVILRNKMICTDPLSDSK
jgi:hypothetical protein